MSRRIFSEIGTIVLALSMSILVWVAAVREEDPITTNLYPQRVTVKVINPSDRLVVANPAELPAEIQIRLAGPRSAWQRLSPARFNARIDLSTLTPGSHEVAVQVTLSDPQLDIVEVIPPQVIVQLEPLIEKRLPANIRLLGEAPTGFTYRLPDEPLGVTIKGPASSVQAVERVEGQIVLNGVREAVEREVRLLPKNGEGETVRPVTIDPTRATVRISVEQKFGYNNVVVKARVIGEPATGYFISRILTEPGELILRGPDEAPRLIETAEINIGDATETITRRVPLILPPGFSIEPEQNQNLEDSRSALVTVEISAFTDGRTIEKNVELPGLDRSLSAQAEPETVELFLTGPWPRLQQLTNDDITVFIDLFGYEPGVYRLPPVVTKPEALNVVTVIPDMIVVTIGSQSLPSTPPAGDLLTPPITATLVITPPRLPTLTPTLTLSDTLTTTVTLTATSIITNPSDTD